MNSVSCNFGICLLAFSTSSLAANCERNPTHPSCNTTVTAAPPEVNIHSVFVNRTLEQIEVRGTALDATTGPFELAGATILPSTITESLTTFSFDHELSAAVASSGNYSLTYGAANALIYIDGAITDSTLDVCPCGDFNSQLSDEGLTNPAPNGSCTEVGTEITSGYLSATYPVDFTEPPIYIIGASYVDGDPSSSVCTMVKIGTSALPETLISQPVDVDQQAACAAVMQANPLICGG